MKANLRAPCGVASFSISIVPGMIRLRTVHLAYSFGPIVIWIRLSSDRPLITRRRVLPGALFSQV